MLFLLLFLLRFLLRWVFAHFACNFVFFLYKFFLQVNYCMLYIRIYQSYVKWRITKSFRVILLNKMSRMAKCPSVLVSKCLPSAWVPNCSPNAPVPKHESAQVSKCFEYPSTQVFLECLSISIVRVNKYPSPLSARVPKCLLITQVPKCPCSVLGLILECLGVAFDCTLSSLQVSKSAKLQEIDSFKFL